MPKTQAQLRRSIVLVGMPGAGKSAVGRALAAELGVPMRDSDAAIVDRASLTIAEIFDRHGEAFFREKESQVIQSLLDGTPCILSTGGGAWMSEVNRRAISAHAAVIWLKADLDLLWSRVRHRDTRPMLMTDDPKATLAELFRLRTPYYAMAEFTLEVPPAWTIHDTKDAAIALMRKAGVIGDSP